jgi:hypothetical protein
MNLLELGHYLVPYSSIVGIRTATYYAYPKFQNKNIKPPLNASTKFVVLATILFFVDVGGDLIMANDATMSSNPLVALI